MTAIQITKDLRAQFGPARDQLERQTCIAFAVSDAHAAAIGPFEPLSVEYLYYHAVQKTGNLPADGVGVLHVCDALLNDGQPSESHWPYLSELPADLKVWVPPASPSPLHKRKHKIHCPCTFKDALDLVHADKPAVVVMTTSDAFHSPMSDHTITSNEPVDPVRRHAVVAVGAGTRSGTDFLLVRNSWGEDWGLEGCAWISEQYTTPRIIALIQLMEAV